MTITLYKYTGEREKVDKSGDLIQVLQTSGEFKADTSILAPSLILSLPTETESLLTDENGNVIDEVQVSVGGKVLDFNYFYIAEFRRYYFVSSIIVSSQSILVVTGEVDPLYSFKDQILENYALVERNEFLYNLYQEDKLIPLKNVKEVSETEIEKSGVANFEFKTTFNLDQYDYTSPNIVVTIADQQPIGGTISGEDGRTIEPKYFNGAGSSRYYATPLESVTRLCQNLMGDYSSYSSFFKSIVAFPFIVEDATGRTPENMRVPKNNYQYEVMTNVKCFTIQTMSEFLYLSDFTMPAVYSFLDLSPYSLYELYIPFYGWYELDIDSLAEHRLLLYYSVNWEDGTGQVYLEDATDERFIFSAPVQLGVSLAITASNAKELENAKYQLENNAALGFVGNGLAIVANAFAKNPSGVIGGSMGALGNFVDREHGLKTLLPRAQSSNNGASGGLYAPIKARLRVTKVKTIEGFNYTDFAHQVGRPLRVVKQLKTLSGFTQIAKIHLEGVTALDMEKRAIESSLLAGVIL